MDLSGQGVDCLASDRRDLAFAVLARISHQMDEPSLDLCIHKKFSSVGNTPRIPLLQKIPGESKSLRDHLAPW